jgi:hypothetical protein
VSPVGRPEIGTPINVRLGDNLLADIDARAYRLGVSRASLIRSMLTAAHAELDDDTIASY